MRKLTAILLSLILIAGMVLSVSAAAGTFLTNRYDVSRDNIYLYGKKLPDNGYLTVSSGNNVLKDVGYGTLGEAGVPVTVYCLLDSSTSQADTMRQQQEDILYTFSSMMTEGDTMVLGLMDTGLVESNLLLDKEERDTAIDTIEGQGWYTNLYDGMSQALDSIYTSTSFNTNCCLVVLSDGHDDGKSEATPEKVLQKIREIGIPVYTVILDAVSMSEEELEYQKQFAEASVGGYLTYPKKDEISASVTAQRIWENIKGSSIIRVGKAELLNSETDQELLIRYETSQVRYEDTVLIRAVDLKGSAPVDPDPLPDKPDDPDPDINLTLILAVGAILLLGAGAVAVILLTRKKSAAPQPEGGDASFPAAGDAGGDLGGSAGQDVFAQTGFAQDSFGSDSFGQTSFGQTSFGGSGGSWSPTAPVDAKCHIYAVALMHPEVTADFYLSPNRDTTFGRTNKSDIILCKDDMKLSGIHGAFHWDGKMLLVKDKGSKNGTYVNGEPCHYDVWLRIENGATLRAGKYEYRITIKNG